MSAISPKLQPSSVSFFQKIGVSQAIQQIRALAKRIGEAIKHCFSRLASLFSRPQQPVKAQILKPSNSSAAGPRPLQPSSVPINSGPSNPPSAPDSVESSPVSVAISEVSKDAGAPIPFNLPPSLSIPSMPSSPAPVGSVVVDESDGEDALSGLDSNPSPSALDVQKVNLFSKQAQGNGACWASLCAGFFALQFMADRILKQLPVFTLNDQLHIGDQGLDICEQLEEQDISLAVVEAAFKRIELPQGKDLIIEPYKPVTLEKGTLCYRRNTEQNSLSEGIAQARILAKNSDSHLAGVVLVMGSQRELPRVFSILIHQDQSEKEREAPVKKDRRHLHIASQRGISKMYVYDSSDKLPISKIDTEYDLYGDIRNDRDLTCELFLYQIRVEPKTT